MCAFPSLLRYVASEAWEATMWTDERVDQLKSLWTEGLSASQIARALGGVTRNAVIGKVHRLGLAGRAAPSRVDRPRLPSAPRLHICARGARAAGGRGRARQAGGWQLRRRADDQRPDVPLADRRSQRGGVSFLRPQPEVRLALLRGARPQGVPAAAAPRRAAADGVVMLSCAAYGRRFSSSEAEGWRPSS